MTKNEIITTYYNDKGIDEALTNLCPHYLRDDLKQHIFLILLEKPEGEVVAMHFKGQLRFFIIRIIINSIRGNGRSDFAKQMADSGHPIEDDNQHAFDPIQYIEEFAEREKDEKKIEQCIKVIENLHPYYKILLKTYVESGSYRKAAAATEFNTMTVFDAVKKAKQQIKEQLHEK